MRVANEAPGSTDLLKELSDVLPPEQTALVQAGDREGVCGASLGTQLVLTLNSECLNGLL